MDKALIDSSTLFDISRAIKAANNSWAQNTFSKLLIYRRTHQKLTISSFTVFELLEGLYRSADSSAVEDFCESVLPNYEVLRPNIEVERTAAEIHAKLRLSGSIIDLPDTFIAATAIIHGLTLVNANSRHFSRVASLGFPLKLENWRDA